MLACRLAREPLPLSIRSRAVMAIWPGSCADLVAALLPHARALGKSWCDYRDESKTTGNAKLIHGEGGVETKRNIELLTVLRGLQENLSFPKSIVRAACLEVAVTLAAEDRSWAMSAEELADYCETLTRRSRNLCRVISQAELKTPCVAWLKKMPWTNRDEDELGRKPIRKRPSAALPLPDYDHGVLDELLLPWRAPAGSKEMETGFWDEAKEDGAPAIGVWPDGWTHEFELTWGELALRSRGRAQAAANLYEAKHPNGHLVVVKQRTDRKLLCCVFEQKKQLLMTNMCLFGPVENEPHQLPPGHPTVQKATAFLRELVDKYVAGDLKDKRALHAARDEALAKEGLSMSKARSKRPAAASSSEAVAPRNSPAPAEETGAFFNGSGTVMWCDFPGVPMSLAERLAFATLP